MDLEQLLAAIGDLSPEERERLRQYLARQQESSKPRTVDEWLAEFQDIANEFRGESSEEEMKEIIQAMTLKSKPSEKGV
jgi:hypothetical protein